MGTQVEYKNPGVYLLENAVAPRTITPATTSLTAFIGPFVKGPTNEAVLVTGMAEFEQQFGGIDGLYLTPYAVSQFFLNGGTGAWIVRIDPSEAGMTAGTGTVWGLTVTSLEPGPIANYVVAFAESPTSTALPGNANALADVSVGWVTADSGVVQIIEHLLALDASSADALTAAVNGKSNYISATTGTLAYNGPATASVPPGATGQIWGLTVAPATTGGGGYTVTFAPSAGSTASQPLADVTVMPPTPAGKSQPSRPLKQPRPLETLTSLDMSSGVALAKAVNSQSNYVGVAGSVITYPLSTASATLGPKTDTTTIWGLTVAQQNVKSTTSYVVTFAPSQSSTPAAPKADVTVKATDNSASQSLTELDASSGANLAAAVNKASNYITVTGAALGPQPPAPQSATLSAGTGNWTATTFETAVTNNFTPGGTFDVIAPQLFNIMCIPDAVWSYPTDTSLPEVYLRAAQFCQGRQAFLLVDPPPPRGASTQMWGGTLPTALDPVGAANSKTITDLEDIRASSGDLAPYSAMYYPWIEVTDPVTNQSRPVPPSGTIAGQYATTDATRGVWKAPAGVDATLIGAVGLADTTMTDLTNGELNVMGVNCLRQFAPPYGYVVWGARTLAGADQLDSPWKYVPVRRLTDFIEQSLVQSLKWAVFELNAPPLWATISLEVGAFMATLYSQGAFGGATAAQAYQVTCDATTTTQEDIDAGRVNVVVAFQPVEPAEFVVITVQIPMNAAAS